jgi:predicted DNA-binding transcriptional regulator YafY
MRRADRLFQIVQLLRRDRAVTAAQIASELEVSERTVYRDVQDLVVNGVPIQGEAGVGYALPASFDLPPLMFDAEEIQALVLGARMVRSWSDPRLAEAAKSALAKVEHVLPPRLANRAAKNRLFAPDFHIAKESLAVMSSIRGALEDQRAMRIEYGDHSEQVTERSVRPLALSFWGRSWTLTAWCELRTDFRTFRIDRIRAAEVLARRFEEEPGRSLEDFFARMQEECASRSMSERRGNAGTSPSNANDGVEDGAVKPPRLDLTDAERRALSRAKLRITEIGSLSGEELFRRMGGAIAPERAGEIAALAAFQRLGSIGLECARDLVRLGLMQRADLEGQDANELYARLCKVTHTRQDPCVEDVLRCAIAQVEHPDLPREWRAWHRWTPLRGSPRSALPPELRNRSLRRDGR